MESGTTTENASLKNRQSTAGDALEDEGGNVHVHFTFHTIYLV